MNGQAGSWTHSRVRKSERQGRCPTPTSPIRRQSTNAYVRSNPMRYTDPDGHCVDTLTCTVEGVEGGSIIAGPVGAVVGGIIGAVAGPVVTAIVAEGLAQNPTAAGSIVGAHAYLSKPAQATGTEGQAQQGQSQQSTPADPERDKPQGPKAKDAPGVTAGGQATNEHGQKLGPSGKPQVNNVSSNTREAARNKANQGSGTVEHRTPTRGQSHFHTKRSTGDKKRDNTHYNYPE